MEYNKRDVVIYTIERRIHDEFASVQSIMTFMTTKGRILKHDWLEVSYMLQMNPLINPNKMECGTMPEKVPLKSSWQEDMELVSAFLDQKVKINAN